MRAYYKLWLVSDRLGYGMKSFAATIFALKMAYYEIAREPEPVPEKYVPPPMNEEASTRLEKIKKYLLKCERLTGPLESNEAQAQSSFISE